VIVHNAIVVQDASGRLRTVAGGTAAEPGDLIPPVRPGTWLWAVSGFVDQDHRPAPRAGTQGPWGYRHALYTIPERQPYLPRARTGPGGAVELAYSVPGERPRYLTARW
jgi:hypothetical protein